MINTAAQYYKVLQDKFYLLTVSEIKQAEKVVYTDFPTPLKDFNEEGVRFNHNELEAIGNDVILLPIQFMADYCDFTCKTMVDQNMACLTETFAANLLEKPAVTLGNVAYIYLNTPDHNLALSAKKVITEYFVEYMQKMNKEV